MPTPIGSIIFPTYNGTQEQIMARAIFTIVVLATSFISLWGLDEDVRSLEGIAQFYVTVALQIDEPVSGISEGSVRNEVELRLRQTGITIPEQNVGPFLLVHIFINKWDEYSFYFTVNVSFYQYVLRSKDLFLVIRDVAEDQLDSLPIPMRLFSASLDHNITARTWSNLILGAAGSLRIADGIDKAVDQLVTGFLNDYLTANPKR